MYHKFSSTALLMRAGIAAIILLLSSFVYGTNSIYKTFEDFQQNHIQDFDSAAYIKKTLHFYIKDGSEVVYKPEEIWGFEYKHRLFRIYKGELYIVDDEGVIFVYGPGLRILYWLNGEKYNPPARQNLRPMDYPGIFISDDLNSDIYATNFSYLGTGVLKPYKKEYQAFMQKYPRHQQLYDCVKDSYSDTLFYHCADIYNAPLHMPVKFQQKWWDFGKHYVAYSEFKSTKELKGNTWIINEGQDPVQIEDIIGNGNTRCEYSKDIILPGEKREIVVYIDAASVIGGMYGKGYTWRSEFRHIRRITVLFKGTRQRTFTDITFVLDVDGTK